MEEELFELKAKLAAVEEAKFEAMMKVELLENDSFEKTILIDYFQLELKEAKEMLNFDMELMEKVVYDNNNYNMSIEAEAKYMEEELRIARRNIDDLHLRVSTVTSEMQCLRAETVRSTERELEKMILSDYFQLELKKAKQLLVNIYTEAETKKMEEVKIPREVELLTTELELQAEIAMLKSELHKGRARVAAAEAAEARALSVKYSLHLAVQELAVELEAAKKNLQILKTESDSGKTEDPVPKTESEDVKILKQGVENELNFGITISLEEYESLCRKSEMMDKIADSPQRNGSQFLNSRNPGDVKILKYEAENEFRSVMITVSLKEYESLCQKAETATEYQIISSEKSQEVKKLQEELEIANADIDALRFAAEEAVRRAEKAEEAKTAVEEQLRRWRQKQMERRAASQQHHESKRRGTLPEKNYANQTKVRNNSVQNVKVLNYVPLGKVLNMKF